MTPRSSLLARLRTVTTTLPRAVTTSSPGSQLLLCALGLAFLVVAAFTWTTTAGWAALGVALLLLELRRDEHADRGRSR